MVAYPPDTDTPGYAKENLSKVRQCYAIDSCRTLGWHLCRHVLQMLCFFTVFLSACSQQSATRSAEQRAMYSTRLSRSVLSDLLLQYSQQCDSIGGYPFGHAVCSACIEVIVASHRIIASIILISTAQGCRCLMFDEGRDGNKLAHCFSLWQFVRIGVLGDDLASIAGCAIYVERHATGSISPAISGLWPESDGCS